jgi:peptidoglycan/LPS O-acetylase OafA/YrhL
MQCHQLFPRNPSDPRENGELSGHSSIHHVIVWAMTGLLLGAKGNASNQEARHFLSHVEGTRAVAVLLVVWYHLFTEQTAGAVDVFFVLTGFLVFSSLLRRFGRGISGALDFLKGLFLRLAPVSLVVLIGIYLGSILFLPKVGINGVHREIIAASLYVENWQLIIQGSDYLERSTPPSPVLHFWAISAQMQFYLLTVVIFVAAVLLVDRFGAGNAPYRKFGVAFFVLFLVSFSYSIYLTYWVNPAWAYFDTFARYWEFVLGVLLAIAIALRPQLQLPWQWGWLGLFGLFAAGALVAPYQPFPGYAALVPTVSTILIILAGRNSSSASVGRLLSLKPMVSLGGVAYTLYLVHWPLMIFYREAFSTSITWLSGTAIFVVSVALSYLLRLLVEKPLLAAKHGKKSGVTLAATSIPLIALAVGGPVTSIYINSAQVTAASFFGTVQTFGFNATLDRDAWYPTNVEEDSVVPPFAVVTESVPPVYRDLSHLGLPCHVGREDRDQVAWCEYGDTNQPTHTIALVGASHSAHWLPPLQVIAERNNWRIVTLTASDCNFLAPHPTRFPFQDCDTLAEKMERGILTMRPDVVITVANTLASAEPEPERIRPWETLDRGGIPVIVIRNNPEFKNQPSRCVEKNLANPRLCATERNAVLAAEFSLGDAPENVSLIDMTDQYCDVFLCPAIIENTLVWRDSGHFTVEFALTMAKVLEERIMAVWTPSSSSTLVESALRDLVPTR